MPRLWHPETGATHEVSTEHVAAVYRRSGWVDIPESDGRDDAAYYLAAAGVTASDASELEDPEPSDADSPGEHGAHGAHGAHGDPWGYHREPPDDLPVD